MTMFTITAVASWMLHRRVSRVVSYPNQ